MNSIFYGTSFGLLGRIALGLTFGAGIAACDSGVECPTALATGFSVTLHCDAAIEPSEAQEVVVRTRRQDVADWKECVVGSSGGPSALCGPNGTIMMSCRWDVPNEPFPVHPAKYVIEASFLGPDGALWGGDTVAQWGRASDDCPPLDKTFEVKLKKVVP